MILYHTLSRGRFFYNAVVASPELIDELDLSHLEAPEGYVYCLLEILDELKAVWVWQAVLLQASFSICFAQQGYFYCWPAGRSSHGGLLLEAAWPMLQPTEGTKCMGQMEAFRQYKACDGGR
jgi:hypothetical protein